MTEQITFDNDDDARDTIEKADSIIPDLERQLRITNRAHRICERMELRNKDLQGYDVGVSAALADLSFDLKQSIKKWTDRKNAALDELGQSAEFKQYGIPQHIRSL